MPLFGFGQVFFVSLSSLPVSFARFAKLRLFHFTGFYPVFIALYEIVPSFASLSLASTSFDLTVFWFYRVLLGSI